MHYLALAQLVYYIVSNLGTIASAERIYLPLIICFILYCIATNSICLQSLLNPPNLRPLWRSK